MDRIKAALDDVMAAAVLGAGWEPALAQFAYASGAHGAVLIRNRAHQMLAAITTDDVTEGVQAFAAGRAPPNSRYSRVKNDGVAQFRIDHDDYTEAELRRDPFYQNSSGRSAISGTPTWRSRSAATNSSNSARSGALKLARISARMPRCSTPWCRIC